MKDFIALYSTTPSGKQAKGLDYHIVHWLNLPDSPKSSWQKIYQDMFTQRPCPATLPLGPFVDIAELDRYCFKIIQQNNLPGIGLLDRERYNRLMENVHNLEELQGILFKKCDYIENPDYKKMGILKRLLN